LVIGQVALAMALLVSAGLMVESFRQLRSLDPGFRPDRVVTGKVALPVGRYAQAADREAFVARLLSSVRGIGGIAAAGVSDAVPMADSRQGTSFTSLDAQPADPAQPSNANFAYVSDGFFEALNITLINGRTFSEQDRLTGFRGIVINELLARQTFGAQSPIGRLVTVSVSARAPFEVIGVVADDRHLGMDADPTPTFFLPYRQVPAVRELALLVRVEGEGSAGVVNTLRAAIRKLDAELPFYQVRTMEEVVDASMATPRSLAWLLSGFALSGLLLAAIGVFGVLSHAVSQRTQEIGVRVAVGASPGQVLRMIFKEGFVQVGLGLVIGIVLAGATSRLLSGLLFGITIATPMPYVVVAVLLLLTAAAACFAPARRAMRIDPATALRGE
jgi:putative ABC transport system permease protein